jgi:3',5'-cyclic AMP phosphodiesterase CpdA
MADNLAACGRELVEWPVKPAAVIVNGDLALNSGTPEDYETFGKLIDPARALAPIHLSLGNHDNRVNFWQAFPSDAARMTAVPNKQVTVFSCERANWFLLDSLDVTSHTPGKLGTAQLDWLGRELDARKDKPALVVCHHPMDVTGLMGLKDTVALDELLMQHQQVKAFIFGHTHNWNIEQHPSGVHLINLPQTAYPFQPGRPSGWVRATLATDGAEFELRCLDPHHPEHAQVTKLKWRKA